MTETNLSNYVNMARRINTRWIVHHNLGHNAGLYLDHLAQTDEPRLAASCRNACLMIERCDPMEDPKPWFYAGLFSLANPDEASKAFGHALKDGIVEQRALKPLRQTSDEDIRAAFGKVLSRRGG